MGINSKEITLNQSLQVIKDCLTTNDEEKELKFLGFKNHKKQIGKMSEDFYSFTVKLICIEFLQNIQNHPKVASVFFSAAHAPPGGAVDSISLRYKVYIKYKKVK